MNIQILDAAFDLIREDVVSSFMKLCLAIDSIIYGIISWLYSVFITIAKARILTADKVAEFVQRMYLIVGIVALFIAAYTFITIIINPDNLSKGNMSAYKLIQNFILSILAVVFVPTIFNFAFAVQKSVVNNNVIPKILFSTSTAPMNNSETNLSEFSITIFETMFYVKDPVTNKELQDSYIEAEKGVYAYNDIKMFQPLLAENVKNEKGGGNKIQYNFGLSGIAGLFIIYVLLVYCIDMGLRTIKLCFLQIIAPLPSLLLMIPGQDKAFKAWFKETIKTFLEVFIKIFIIVFGVYLIQLIKHYFDDSSAVIFKGSSTSVVAFAKLFIFMGICMFIKKAPKLISDIFGIDFGENGFSLSKRLNEFKESLAPVIKPIDKIAGAAAGYHYANRARKIGERVRGDHGSPFRNFMTSAGGVVNGFRGGFKRSGYAFDYEMANQQWYSTSDYKNSSVFGKLSKGTFNRLRNNMGAPSLYEEMKQGNELDFYYKNEALERKIQARKKAADNYLKQINDDHDPVIERDKAYADAQKTIMDICKEKVGKVDSKVTTTGVLSAKYNEALKTWTYSASKAALNSASIDAINAETNKLLQQGLPEEMMQKIITENTKLQKKLAGYYYDNVDQYGRTVDYSGDDVELKNAKANFDLVKEQYKKLGEKFDGTSGYTPIDSSAKFSAIKDLGDAIKAANAQGEKNRSLQKEIPYDDENGVGCRGTLFDIQKEMDKFLKDQKELNELQASRNRALDGMSKLDAASKKHLASRNDGKK
ncbi:MAG: hypothetical protein IKX00_04625 [Bacilli bacterium]|nr:hypothetical protein [Bacilli bacterium]